MLGMFPLSGLWKTLPASPSASYRWRSCIEHRGCLLRGRRARIDQRNPIAARTWQASLATVMSAYISMPLRDRHELSTTLGLILSPAICSIDRSLSKTLFVPLRRSSAWPTMPFNAQTETRDIQRQQSPSSLAITSSMAHRAPDAFPRYYHLQREHRADDALLPSPLLSRLQRCPLLCRFSDAGDDDRLCTLKRPAFEKRQGRKSRSVVRRRFGWLYGDLAGASGLGCVVMIHTPVRLDRDPAVNERVARRATRICGTSGCELSGSRRAWALSAASRRE